MGFSLGGIGKGISKGLGGIGGAGGQLAGGFGGFLEGFGDQTIQGAKNFGDYYTQGDFHDQYSAQKEFAQYGLRWKAEDARRAGLHPLAALGSQTQSFSPISVGNPLSGVLDAANSGANLYNTFKGLTAEEDYMQLLNIAQAKEKLKQMKLESQGMENQLQQQQNTPNVNYGSTIDEQFGVVGTGRAQAVNPQTGQPIPITGYKFKENEIPYSSQIGLEAGVTPMERYAIDVDGNMHRVPSSELEETMESDAFTQLKYAAMRGSRWAKNLYGYFQSGDGAREYRKWLYDNRPPDPDPEHEFRYDPYWDSWKLVRKLGPDQSYLYHSGGGESDRYNYAPGHYVD